MANVFFSLSRLVVSKDDTLNLLITQVKVIQTKYGHWTIFSMWVDMAKCLLMQHRQLHSMHFHVFNCSCSYNGMLKREEKKDILAFY